MFLTVAIPTYNRPDKLTDTVVRLLPQLTTEVKLLVLDNCSETIIKDYLGTELGNEVLNKVEVVRHRVNIGADANFQRCFELCTTPYIWLLGDDDRIAPDAIKLIIHEINKFKHLDLIGINFNSSLCMGDRTKSVTINNKKELIEKLDHFWNWVFISTTIYKTDEYLKNLRFTSVGAYSMVSQLYPAMISICNSNKVFVLSNTYIVDNQNGIKPAWSRLQLNLALTSILELPVKFKSNEHLDFGRKLSAEFIPLGAVFVALLKSINWDVDLIDKYHIYIFKQLYTRTYQFRDNRFVESIKYRFGLLLLYNKVLTKILIKNVPWFKKKAEDIQPFFLFER